MLKTAKQPTPTTTYNIKPSVKGSVTTKNCQINKQTVSGNST
jgi:hypothetical protein